MRGVSESFAKRRKYSLSFKINLWYRTCTRSASAERNHDDVQFRKYFFNLSWQNSWISDDSQYEQAYTKLLERIYGVDIQKKPLLGENPFADNLAQEISFKTKTESSKYSSPAVCGIVSFDYRTIMESSQSVQEIVKLKQNGVLLEQIWFMPTWTAVVESVPF